MSPRYVDTTYIYIIYDFDFIVGIQHRYFVSLPTIFYFSTHHREAVIESPEAIYLIIMYK